MAAQLQAAQSKGPAFTKIICPAYAILAAKVTECNVLLAQGFCRRCRAQGAGRLSAYCRL